MADKKTWMTLTAGILDIVCGSWELLVAFILTFVGGATRLVPDVPAFLAPLFAALAVPFLILGILAIVGGIYALLRKAWGMALAGSIAAFFSPWLWFLGIAAIVLTALAKNDFK